MNDDYGDRFPEALPAPRTARSTTADERIVHMHAAYVQKANSLVQAGQEDLAQELAETFAEESAAAGREASGGRRAAGRRTPTRGEGGRRPETDTRLGRMGRITRSSLNRFDRYTLDVFNAGSTYRSDRSA
jgi:hypothetical protein